MIKIWNEAFLKKQPEIQETQADAKLRIADYFPLAVLAAASLLMGIFAATVFHFTMLAANQLIDPALYIETVLRNNTP
jgi:multicomponent Na+:H+ antiporter subunit D